MRRVFPGLGLALILLSGCAPTPVGAPRLPPAPAAADAGAPLLPTGGTTTPAPGSTPDSGTAAAPDSGSTGTTPTPDAGSTTPTAVPCCSGIGTCLDATLIPAEHQSLFPMDSCASAQLCLPNIFIEDPNARFQTCTYDFGLFGGSGPGACVPQCMLAGQANAGDLSRESCSSGHLCVPCEDPRDGSSTGACQ